MCVCVCVCVCVYVSGGDRIALHQVRFVLGAGALALFSSITSYVACVVTTGYQCAMFFRTKLRVSSLPATSVPLFNSRPSASSLPATNVQCFSGPSCVCRHFQLPVYLYSVLGRVCRHYRLPVCIVFQDQVACVVTASYQCTFIQF